MRASTGIVLGAVVVGPITKRVIKSMYRGSELQKIMDSITEEERHELVQDAAGILIDAQHVIGKKFEKIFFGTPKPRHLSSIDTKATS